MIDFIEFMEKECNSPGNVFGKEFFQEHVLIVRNIAVELAEMLNADRNVVEVAALLHDIAAIREPKCVKIHNIVGAEIAQKLLSERGYNEESISRIAICIRNHSNPLKIGQSSIEEVCVSNADAISQIINPVYWLYYVFHVLNFDYKSGLEWYSKRIDSNWSGLADEVRPRFKNLYDQTRLIVDQSKEN